MIWHTNDTWHGEENNDGACIVHTLVAQMNDLYQSVSVFISMCQIILIVNTQGIRHVAETEHSYYYNDTCSDTFTVV